MADEKVTIIGAGLAGSLLAIYLARRGMHADIYEARGDMRLEAVAPGRSINLALSDRGITALREVGMDDYMLAEAVPMYGRMVHAVSGETRLLPYSGREGEYINSVSRAGLNIALINEAEKYPNIRFFFSTRCIDFDCGDGMVYFASGKSVKSATVIATDGAGSAIRHAFERDLPQFSVSQVFLEHGYKELHIPPITETAGSSAGHGKFALEPNALHIWPRHKFMMIALPNFDGSFTCTLFLAHKKPPDEAGRDSDSTIENAISTPAFDSLNDGKTVMKFFLSQFSDAVPLMPTLIYDFFRNPTGNLGTIKCFPWNCEGRALLLGDSAHAVVPFYGQGMNCAFEDVRVLDTLIEKHGADWETIYEEYSRLRKENTDAIADMAEENFIEMRDAVADPVFLRKRELETLLEQNFPDYFSKYSMVTFREDLPYSVARTLGNAQDNLLMEICCRVNTVGEINLNDVMERIRNLTPANKISD